MLEVPVCIFIKAQKYLKSLQMTFKLSKWIDIRRLMSLSLDGLNNFFCCFEHFYLSDYEHLFHNYHSFLGANCHPYCMQVSYLCLMSEIWAPFISGVKYPFNLENKKTTLPDYNWYFSTFMTLDGRWNTVPTGLYLFFL